MPFVRTSISGCTYHGEGGMREWELTSLSTRKGLLVTLRPKRFGPLTLRRSNPSASSDLHVLCRRGNHRRDRTCPGRWEVGCPVKVPDLVRSPSLGSEGSVPRPLPGPVHLGVPRGSTDTGTSTSDTHYRRVSSRSARTSNESWNGDRQTTLRPRFRDTGPPPPRSTTTWRSQRTSYRAHFRR